MITSIWSKPGEMHETALEIRKSVFQDELGWPQEKDCDFMDPYAFHLVLLLDGTPVAAGRMSYYGVGKAKLDRICVVKRYRRQGIGDGLVKILDFKAACSGMQKSVIETVPELRRFYLRIGFIETGKTVSKEGETIIIMEKETNDGSSGNCAHQCTCEKG